MTTQIKAFGTTFMTVPVTDALLSKYRVRFMIQLLKTELNFRQLITSDRQLVGRMRIRKKMTPRGRVLFVHQQADGTIEGMFCSQEEYINPPLVFFLRKEDMMVLTPTEEEPLSVTVQTLTNQPIENLLPYTDALFDLLERAEAYRLEG